MFDIAPKKCCLKYDPPTLVLFYEISPAKLHRRSIPIKDLPMKEGNLILKDLYKSHHGKYLEKFNSEQIVRLLNILIEKSNGIKITKTNNENFDEINFNKDNLNKLDDKKLNEVKKHMNNSFEKNQVKPGDQDWKYDIEVDFEAGDSGHGGDQGGIETAGWDDESDMEF